MYYIHVCIYIYIYIYVYMCMYILYESLFRITIWMELKLHQLGYNPYNPLISGTALPSVKCHSHCPSMNEAGWERQSDDHPLTNKKNGHWIFGEEELYNRTMRQLTGFLFRLPLKNVPCTWGIVFNYLSSLNSEYVVFACSCFLGFHVNGALEASGCSGMLRVF